MAILINDLENKNYTLLSAIKKFGTIKGKKALQKILYFINLDCNNFPYQWNKYGPYSEEVKYLLEDEVTDQLVSVTAVSLASKSGTQYNMNLTPKGLKYLKSVKNNKKVDKRIEFIHSFLNDKSPREMELLASVHYIASYNKGAHSHRVFDIITSLKPEANFDEKDVKNALSELTKLKLLN